MSSRIFAFTPENEEMSSETTLVVMFVDSRTKVKSINLHFPSYVTRTKIWDTPALEPYLSNNRYLGILSSRGYPSDTITYLTRVSGTVVGGIRIQQLMDLQTTFNGTLWTKLTTTT